VNREEALREILRRAHREHGTCVLALRRIERELTELRRRVAEPGQVHPSYRMGMASALQAVEECLFEIFRVKPERGGPPEGGHQ